MEMTAMNREHAIVAGGSVGGLMAAAALARHFRRVTLLERDAFPEPGEQRRGVPQGRHAHALLAGGSAVFDKYFPGFTDELVAAGGVPGDPGDAGRWYQEGGYMARARTGMRAVMASRPLVEGLLRRRVLALSNVCAIVRCEALGPLTTADKRQVTGVRLRRAGGFMEELRAGLVVDATGRGSRSGEWLQWLGYKAPDVEKVEVAIGYTTRLFHRRPADLDGDLFAVTTPTPQEKRGGVMLCLEGGRWIVTLTGYFGNYAPVELEGFREFARRLPCRDIFSVVKDAEPLGDGIFSRFPASVRHRVEGLKPYPEGIITFGDSICSFNPLYGQGMSVAALQAEALDSVLAQGGEDFARRFFKEAARVIDTPWKIAVGNDLRIPETSGPRTAEVQFVNWYMAKLLKASHNDPDISAAFHRVGNLLAPPQSLLSPRIAASVALAGFAGGHKTPSWKPTEEHA